MLSKRNLHRYIKDRLAACPELKDSMEFVHFACTSVGAGAQVDPR